MNRRRFLTGTIYSVAATSAVVAFDQTPAGLLTPSTEVVLAETIPASLDDCSPGSFVYSASGHILGIIKEVVVHRDTIVEDTLNGVRLHLPGLLRGTLTADLTGPFPNFRGNTLVKG